MKTYCYKCQKMVVEDYEGDCPICYNYIHDDEEDGREDWSRIDDIGFLDQFGDS